MSRTRSNPRKQLSFPKKLLFSCVLGAFFVLIAVGALLALDLYLHHKFDRTGTVNYRGYRGSIVGKKQPNELRLVVLGGSTAYGYGVTWDQSFPALLEKRLRAETHRPVTVVNLAYNTQGSYSFLPTLKDYEYLQYDGVILYEGYNDLSWNTSVFRHDSPIFTTFGYYPILPVVLSEKALALRGGNAQNGSRGKKTVFNPGLADRTKAGAMEAAAKVAESLQGQFRERGPAAPAATAHSPYCTDEWAFYCNNVDHAVSYAVGRNKPTLVVGQPYIGPLHRRQQTDLASMLQRKYADSPIVRYVNLGNAVDLHDAALAYDGMHLLPPGNQIIADNVAGPVLAIFRDRVNP